MGKSQNDITEAQFATQLEDLFDIYHWTYSHFRPGRTMHGWRTSITGHKGFPDYVAVRSKLKMQMTIFAEIKRKGEKPTPEQRDWLDILYQAGNHVFLWYPADVEEIVSILVLQETPQLTERTKFKSSWGNRR